MEKGIEVKKVEAKTNLKAEIQPFRSKNKCKKKMKLMHAISVKQQIK